ncbi:MAG: hypothetical protein EZS28_024772 [Streblomastix strix]|uniref:Protein kinase domain-containing protein n=1 Tax=Streblomastix strix TaxID=222440 RepID=A0A5J4VB71_9EUKA|nr:MAG: hypothetical protein EZS28_024772 [Streblomastix strix]
MDFSKVTYQDIKFIKKLGYGSQGSTYHAILNNKLQCTIKKQDFFSEEDKEIVNREIEQMKKLNTRFTVRLICSIQQQEIMYFVMEYCPQGNLRKVISDFQKLPEQERVMRTWTILAQILRSLGFLHWNKVIINGLKPENIFLMMDGSIRIGDSGFIKQIINDEYSTTFGTKIYTAAEVWTQKKIMKVIIKVIMKVIMKVIIIIVVVIVIMKVIMVIMSIESTKEKNQTLKLDVVKRLHFNCFLEQHEQNQTLELVTVKLISFICFLAILMQIMKIIIILFLTFISSSLSLLIVSDSAQLTEYPQVI